MRGSSRRRCAIRRKNRCWRARAPSPMPCLRSRARVFRDTDDGKAFAASRGDLYVFPLHTQPLLDGYRDDWDVAAEPAPLPTSTGYGARALAGSTERYLYLYIEVDDRHFDPEPADPQSRPGPLRSDRFGLAGARRHPYLVFLRHQRAGTDRCATHAGRRPGRGSRRRRAADPGILAAILLGHITWRRASP